MILVMSLLSDLINLNLSDTTEKVIAEYIWLVSFLSLFLSVSQSFFLVLYEHQHNNLGKCLCLCLLVCTWFFYVCRNFFFSGMKKNAFFSSHVGCGLFLLIFYLITDTKLGLTEDISLFLSLHEQIKVSNFSDGKMLKF